MHHFSYEHDKTGLPSSEELFKLAVRNIPLFDRTDAFHLRTCWSGQRTLRKGKIPVLLDWTKKEYFYRQLNFDLVEIMSIYNKKLLSIFATFCSECFSELITAYLFVISPTTALWFLSILASSSDISFWVVFAQQCVWWQNEEQTNKEAKEKMKKKSGI